MGSIGLPESLVIVPFVILSLITAVAPLVLMIWALVLLNRLNAGQQSVIDRLVAIERLLQRPEA